MIRRYGQDRNQLIVLFLSLSLAIFFFLIYPGVFTSDSFSYYDNARILAGKLTQTGEVFYRPPGYPLLLILTGVVHGNTFWGLMIVQAIMAVAMPLLIYKTLQLIDPPAAFYAALLAIVSLVPYSYMKAVLTETPYMFFLLLAIYLAALYFTSERVRFFYLMVLVTAILAVIRPSANLLFVAFLFLFLVFKPGKFLHYVVGFFLVLGVLAGISNLHARKFGIGGNYGTVTNMTGKLIFFNVYLSSRMYSDSNASPFREENGPVTAQMIDIVEDYLVSNPQSITWRREARNYDHFFGKYESDPRGLAQAIFSDPARTYYWFLWDVMDEAVGPTKSEGIFWRVSLEKLRSDPILGLKFFLRNLRAFFLGLPIEYTYEIAPAARLTTRNYFLTITRWTPALIEEKLPQSMVRELLYDFLKDKQQIRYLLLSGWSILFSYFRPLIFFMMVINAPFLLSSSKARPVALLCLLTVVYSAAIVCLFSEPLDRYVYHTFLVEVMIGTGALLFSLGRWRYLRVDTIPELGDD